MRIFVTGASGFIGRAISEALLARGDAVAGLTRAGQVARGAEVVTGDPTKPGEWQAAVAECDALIHLAGEPIAGARWTPARKNEIRRSRVEGTRQVVAAMAAAERCKALLSASGVDLYPFDESNRGYGEDEEGGATFLAEVCRDWEDGARAAERHGKRVAVMRTGIVLGKGEGAMAKLSLIFKSFAGGPIGDGRQWLSWVHVDDVAAAYLHALDKGLSGPVNVVTDSTRQADFARSLGDVLKRPSWLPVPGFALKIALGELADYVLHGRRVVPSVLERSGFTPRHATLAAALAKSV